MMKIKHLVGYWKYNFSRGWFLSPGLIVIVCIMVRVGVPKCVLCRYVDILQL